MDRQNKFMLCRESVYDNYTRKILLARISDSEQEKDLSLPPNCEGFGRIRHFRRRLDDDWFDPLPMDPMSKSLDLPYVDLVEAQVFQIASCNLRCWYCFVPDNLKNGDQIRASSFTAEEMIELFAEVDDNIRLLDLSGGNPELVPEWLVDTMKALDKRGLKEHIYLWSDDTLTTDYFFQYLSKDDMRIVRNYPHYGKVGCFKGFDQQSFCFNTNLDAIFYERQFELFTKYLEIGLDVYGYVTFTTDNIDGIDNRIHDFINRLQKIHPLLPLRVVPLKIVIFSPVQHRINSNYKAAIDNQIAVHHEWRKQLRSFYSDVQLNQRISDIMLV